MGRRKRRRGWGEGEIEQLKSGYWRIRWHEGGRRRSAKYEDQADAESVLARIRANVRAGRPSGHVSPTPGAAPQLSELAERWLDRRRQTHRAWRDDQNRWRKHLKPSIGHLPPDQVNAATVRRLVEQKLVEGLSPQSVGNVVRLLSTFYSDLIEQGHALSNPARALPRATRRLIKGTHDPKQTPFIERQGDIAKVYAGLAQPFATIFAVGALAGLRPGEIIALEWGDVDLSGRRILVQRQVRHGKVGPTKSGKPRLVPIIEALVRILAEWRLGAGGDGLLFKPLTPWRSRSKYIKDTTIRDKLRDAFKACGLPATMTWYSASRHTYASQHVMGGGSLGTLREILGHSSVTVTERYAHLRPDLFRPEDLLQLSVGMSREGGKVVDLSDARRRAADQPSPAEETGSGNGIQRSLK